MVILLITSIPLSLKYRIPPIPLGLLNTLVFTSKLTMTPYDKRDDFNFPIVNFPFICSNIPVAPAYGVYFSRLIRYYRACSSYHDFLNRGLLLATKIVNQVITSKVLRLPPWHVWPLWNICVTNDHRYVPLVVSTSRSFFVNDLSPGL